MSDRYIPRAFRGVPYREEPWVEGENGHRSRITTSSIGEKIEEHEKRDVKGRRTYYSRATDNTFLGIRYENGVAVEEQIYDYTQYPPYRVRIDLKTGMRHSR
jgi:hypothetical protein